MLHVELNGNVAENTMQANILPQMESKGQCFFFSEDGHVAYQIKEKEV